MRRMRRVKIVATLGPASQDIRVIEELARAGADVFRINMSHASHDLMRETVARIRELENIVHFALIVSRLSFAVAPGSNVDTKAVSARGGREREAPPLREQLHLRGGCTAAASPRARSHWHQRRA